MKYKGLIIATILYFLYANTWPFWIDKLLDGFQALPAFILAYTGFFIFCLVFLWHFVHAIAEKFSSKSRTVVLFILGPVLFITYFQPLARMSTPESENELLIASREGAANCNTTFRLRPDNKFTEKTVCFGIDEVSGEYEQKGDTLLFKNVELGRGAQEYYKFAVIKEKESPNKKFFGDLIRYRNFGDTTGDVLWITKKLEN